MANRQLDIRRNLYDLKQMHGQAITLYRKGIGATDFQTGVTTITLVVQEIALAIVMPEVTQDRFQYNLGYVAANKNFTYGGFFQVGDRLIIIDATDLSAGYVPDTTDYVVYDAQRFTVAQVTRLDFKIGYGLLVRQTQNEAPEQVISKIIRHHVGLAQTVSHG